MSDAPVETTYLVVGADGSTYGPANFETLKGWVDDGRIVASTMLINEQTQVRLQARYIPGLIKESAAGTAPPVQAGPVYEEGPAPRKASSAWVVAAIVVIGGCLGCGVIGAAILFPVFASSKRAAQKTVQLSNLKQLATGMLIYSTDYDDRLPLHMESARTFGPALDPYVKNRSLFISTNPAGGEILGNKKLSGKPMNKLERPADTVMIYDSLPWSGEKALVAYTDGHATSSKPFSIAMGELQRDPFKP